MPMLEAGFAQRDITPDPGTVYLDGYGFRLKPAEGIRDRLYVKVCIFACGEEKFALAAFDICGMSASVYDYVSGHIEGFSHWERSHFALACTHTHAAPACGVLDGLPINWDWLAFVAEMASEAITEAVSKIVSGHFSFSICGILKYAYNRRGRSPIDRRIRCAAFASENGEIRGILASAACHAVVNTSLNVSADFLSVLTQEADRLYPGVPVLFISGRGSDIDPFNPDGLSQEALLLALGHDLADQVFSFADAVAGLRHKAADTAIISSYACTTVPMKPLSSAEAYMLEIKKLTTAYKKEKEALARHCILRELDYNRKMLKLKQQGKSPDLIVPLQILVLSNIAVFVMLPFEILTLTGNAVEDMLRAIGFAPETIYICGNSNSVNGYLAPHDELEYGGYEVSGAACWYGLAECCEQSESAVLRRIEEMLATLGLTSQQRNNSNGEI